MPEPDLFRIFISPLSTLDIPYMVTGAVASIIYGEPRMTHDIDLVIEITPGNAQEFVNAFPPEEFYCPPVEIIKLESRRPLRGHFNLIHQETGFKADIYPIGEDRLHEWGMSKRRQIAIEGESLWVAPPEYVIVRKLEYYREGHSEKHMRDIRGMLEVSADQIDLEEIDKKAGGYGLQKEWQQAKKPTQPTK